MVAIAYSLLVLLLVDGLKVASPTQAAVFAFAGILPISFFAHRSLSFRDAARDRFQGYRFAVTATSSFVVVVGTTYLMNDVLKLHYLFGLAVAWGLIPLTNFAINSVWVFQRRSDADAGSEPRSRPLR